MSLDYLLDSNVCIAYLNGSNNNVLNKLKTISTTTIAVCAIVEAELFYGSGKSNNPTKARANQVKFLQTFTSLPFDSRAALIFGDECARLDKIGRPIGKLDLMIASIAIANNLILVTNNTREFSRVQGLTYEDWHSTP